ncbi:MAG: transcriptional repressor [Planctomycetaceae bacterium]|nr:transcriptional repressor [Planctomycetaceae bacterium]
MTNSSSIPSLPQARNLLRKAGLRATPCRVAVVQYLSGILSPASHQEACQELEERGFDKSTIFRTLNDLSDSGLARRMELGDHVWRYELIETSSGIASDAAVHPHLLCTDCGSITCLSHDEVQISIVARIGDIKEVLLKGHCSQCRSDRS